MRAISCSLLSSSWTCLPMPDVCVTPTHTHTQYLGATEVTKTHGPGSTDDAVKTIVHHVSDLCCRDCPQVWL